ncbi:serpin family protein [Rarobacter incanus]|uniref:Serpin B n=1 Tax=Rarobacter incanus TaxID=153494 RepID=A0A542SL87_9MICO|nr:serpin family protein [Rarobacter incanus]TQK75400.1 serpin B [Rarobacter incanus]
MSPRDEAPDAPYKPSPSWRVIAATAAALSVLAMTACGARPYDPARGGTLAAKDVTMRTVAIADASSLPKVVAAARTLGLATLGSDTDPTAVSSPSSFAVALAMLAEGAKGKTLSDLDSALGASGEDRRDAFAAILSAMRKYDGDPALAGKDSLPDSALIHQADRVVIDTGFAVNDSYLNALADGFGANMQQAELSDASGKKILDSWVKKNTGGLIKQSAIEANDSLRVVLQSAIVFAAKWAVPFLERDTTDRTFTLLDGSKVTVPMMGWNDESAAYADLTGGWVALRLPYSEGAYADLLLPPKGTDPATATADLLAQAADKLAAATPGPTKVALPILDFTGTVDLSSPQTLQALGLGSALCDAPDADLSGIAGSPGDLCVQQVAQQVALHVSEDGTKAAAVTELGMDAAGAAVDPVRTIEFDRPYLLTINQADTGWPLFYAAVRNPAV